MSAAVAVLAELLACASDTVAVDVLLLSDSNSRYLVDKNGVPVVLNSCDVIDYTFNSELDISLTLPRTVAQAKGLC